MKRIIIATGLIALTACGATKADYKDILQTTDTAKIEDFLRNSNPDDPRRTVLKPKLIALKNAEWTKGAKNAKPMEARPIVMEIPNSVLNNPNSAEAEEFKKLLTENSKEHSDKTVKLLNTLFNSDISSKDAILLIQNNSDCNMIVRITGNKFFNLAVPAHGENSLVLDKGNYNLASNVCGMAYQSQKNIQKSMLIILNNPVVDIKSKK